MKKAIVIDVGYLPRLLNIFVTEPAIMPYCLPIPKCMKATKYASARNISVLKKLIFLFENIFKYYQ